MVHDRTSFSTQTSPSKKSLKYWRWLFPLALLASLGMHGLVLFSPVSPSDDELVPPPDPEEDGIAIIKIDAPQPRPQAVSPANATDPNAVRTARPAAPTAATRAPQTAPTQGNSASGPAAAPRRADSSTAGRGRTPAANTRANRNQASQANRPTVPDLSAVDSVRNPNTPAPNVASPTSSAATAAASSADLFEEYVKVFEAYNGVKISEEDATTFRQRWLESFRDRGSDFADLDVQPLRDFDPLPYASNICLPNSPQAAQVLVMVNADGEVDEYQQFIQRTGYRNFDSAARQAIESHAFPEADTPQAYLAEIEVDYDSDECEWPPEVDKLPDDYFAVLETYVGPTLTTPAEATAAREAWLKTLSTAEENELPQTDEFVAANFEDFDQKVDYPLAICLPIEPKNTQWGVIVNADGSLNSEPELLRSAGYQNFDDRAKELVENFDFAETGESQLYVVEVPVDYNSVNCQSLDSDEFEVPTATYSASNNGGEPLSDAASPGATSPQTTAFNPEQQARLIEAGRQNIEANTVGSLNALPEIAAASIESGWPDGIDRSCFLANLTPEQGPIPVDAAEDAVILSESFDFVPLTLSRLYGAEVIDAGEYCGAPLLQMTLGGTPQLFSSTIGFGAGNSNALVIIWSADPRE